MKTRVLPTTGKAKDSSRQRRSESVAANVPDCCRIFLTSPEGFRTNHPLPVASSPRINYNTNCDVHWATSSVVAAAEAERRERLRAILGGSSVGVGGNSRLEGTLSSVVAPSTPRRTSSPRRVPSGASYVSQKTEAWPPRFKVRDLVCGAVLVLALSGVLSGVRVIFVGSAFWTCVAAVLLVPATWIIRYWHGPEDQK